MRVVLEWDSRFLLYLLYCTLFCFTDKDKPVSGISSNFAVVGVPTEVGGGALLEISHPWGWFQRKKFLRIPGIIIFIIIILLFPVANLH